MMEPIRYREHSFRPDNDPVWRKRGLKTFLPRRLLGLIFCPNEFTKRYMFHETDTFWRSRERPKLGRALRMKLDKKNLPKNSEIQWIGRVSGEFFTFVCQPSSSLDMVHWAWEYDPDFFDGVRLADEPNEISLLLYTCCISFLKGNYSHQRSNFAELAHDCIPIIFGQFGSSLNNADRYVLDRYREIVGLP